VREPEIRWVFLKEPEILREPEIRWVFLKEHLKQLL